MFTHSPHSFVGTNGEEKSIPLIRLLSVTEQTDQEDRETYLCRDHISLECNNIVVGFAENEDKNIYTYNAPHPQCAV